MRPSLPEAGPFLVPLILTTLLWFAAGSMISNASRDAPILGPLKRWWADTPAHALYPVQLGLSFITMALLVGLGLSATDQFSGGYGFIAVLGLGTGLCLTVFGALRRRAS